MRNGEVIERPADHRTLTRRYTDEAVRFIDANKARPFFLYLAHTLPHIPLARSAEFVGHSAGGIYGDVDRGDRLERRARILDALRTAGIDRRTLVVFTSDNGPWLPFETHGGSAGPLRDGKGTTWEGGVRTPAIFWWPGTVRPATSRTSDRRWTCSPRPRSSRAREVPADRVIDGVDLRARAHRIRAEPAPAAVLLLGQRAAGGAQGRLQGALHHQRRVRRRRRRAPSTIRRFSSTSPRIPASATTSPRCTRTSWPISSKRPRRIGKP